MSLPTIVSFWHGPLSWLEVLCIRFFVRQAVPYIKRDAPLLADLMTIFEQQSRPLLEPHLPPLRRVEVALRRLFGDRVSPEHMQYGATGPMALTHYVKKHGLIDLVLPSEVFYPVPYEGIPGLMKAGSRLEPSIGPDTMAIHLWRSQLTDRGRAGLLHPEPDSALARLLADRT